MTRKVATRKKISESKVVKVIKNRVSKSLKNKATTALNKQLKRQLRTSFIFYLIKHIIFFPYYLAKLYLYLMYNYFRQWVILNIIGCVLCAVFLIFVIVTLPNVDDIYDYNPTLSSKFYDRNGNLMVEMGEEKRTFIDIKDIPEHLKEAFIAAEDRTFYTNMGFDPIGLARAGINDIYRLLRRQKLEGASTITQQVVKNILLTNEQTITRKIKELILSVKLANSMPKEKILEVYLNHIYLGKKAYGVVAASAEYFNKSVSQLTLGEMAMLAAMPKAPSYINPFKNYNRAIDRRNWVLYRMYEDGYITKEEYLLHSKSELVLKKSKNAVHDPMYAPVFFARGMMENKEIVISSNDIMKKGYRIDTTIDINIQKIAQTALNKSLEEYTKNHGFAGPIYSYDVNDVEQKTSAELLRGVDEPENIGDKLMAVVLHVENESVKIGLADNSDGIIELNEMKWARQKISETVRGKEINTCQDVLKVGDVIIVKPKTLGSNYYSLEQIPQIQGGVVVLNPKNGEVLSVVGGYLDQAGTFNRAVQAFRQVGSTIKPFVYGTALENGYTPSSIFMDSDVSIDLGNGISWTPANSTKKTNGPTTLRNGLARSLNTVTIRIANDVGIAKVCNTIQRAQINKNPQYNLSVAIGSVESTLMQMATAFGAIANNGKLPNTYMIKSISKLAENENLFGRVYFSNCNAGIRCDLTIAKPGVKSLLEDKNKQEDEEKQQTLINSGNMLENDDDEKQDEDFGTVEEQNAAIEANINKQHSLTEMIDGKQLPNYTAFSPQTAYQLASILQGAVNYGTSYKLQGLGIPVAAKTGTSDGGRDMWTIAFTPNIVVAVYIGFDNPTDTNNYGGQYASPVVRDILVNLLHKYSFGSFITPEGIKMVKVDRKTGRPSNAEGAIFEAFKEWDQIPTAGSNSSVSGEEDIDITDLDV